VDRIGLIQDTDKWQAVVNAAMNLKYTEHTIGLLGQFGLLLLQQVSALYGHHQGDNTELTDGITKVVRLNVRTVMHSCYTGHTDRCNVICTVSIITLMMALAGRNRFVLSTHQLRAACSVLNCNTHLTF